MTSYEFAAEHCPNCKVRLGRCLHCGFLVAIGHEHCEDVVAKWKRECGNCGQENCVLDLLEAENRFLRGFSSDDGKILLGDLSSREIVASAETVAWFATRNVELRKAIDRGTWRQKVFAKSEEAKALARIESLARDYEVRFHRRGTRFIGWSRERGWIPRIE